MTNWPTEKLGEICQIKTGKKDVDEGNSNGKYPFFSCSREITYSDTYSFDTEAILIAGNGDVGNSKIYKGKFEAYQRTYVLDDFKDDIKYIYYYLIGNLKRILVKSKSGSTMPYIRKGDLANLQIPLSPPPIQQKIVRILDIIQRAVEMQDKIIELAKGLKKSLMAKLFREGAPSFSRGRKLKKTEIGEIPENWEMVNFGQFERTKIEIIDGDRGINYPKNSEFSKEGYCLFLNTKNIPSDKFDFSECNFITKEKDELLRKGKLQAGDIVLTTRGTVGNAAIYNEKVSYENMRINSGMIILRNTGKNFLTKFVHLLLIGPIIQKQFKNYGSGSAQPQLPINVLQKIDLIKPPLPEQREIAEILSTIDRKIGIEQKKKGLYEELFKAMLNKIMKQKIDVESLEL